MFSSSSASCFPQLRPSVHRPKNPERKERKVFLFLVPCVGFTTTSLDYLLLRLLRRQSLNPTNSHKSRPTSEELWEMMFRLLLLLSLRMVGSPSRGLRHRIVYRKRVFSSF